MGRKRIGVLAIRRTPFGAFQGMLSGYTAVQLGGIAGKGALKAAGIPATEIQQVLGGSVILAGQKQNPGRRAALAAGIPETVPGSTVNKVCGTFSEIVRLICATMTGDPLLVGGRFDCMMGIAFESMTNAPGLMLKHRTGYRMGPFSVFDSMLYDGLENEDGGSMGKFADGQAARLQLSRRSLDDFALRSIGLSHEANVSGLFADEIVGVPIQVPGEDGEEPSRGELLVDEYPSLKHAEGESKLRGLRAAFDQSIGLTTAGNASAIADAGVAGIFATDDYINTHGLKPTLWLESIASASLPPMIFVDAPDPSVRAACAPLKLEPTELDVLDINEAFASVAIGNARSLGFDPMSDRINPNGGAIGLGHPVSVSGGRQLGSLARQIREKNGRGIGAVVQCIGMGEALTIVASVPGR